MRQLKQLLGDRLLVVLSRDPAARGAVHTAIAGSRCAAVFCKSATELLHALQDRRYDYTAVGVDISSGVPAVDALLEQIRRTPRYERTAVFAIADSVQAVPPSVHGTCCYVLLKPLQVPRLRAQIGAAKHIEREFDARELRVGRSYASHSWHTQ